jgi:hypothetical protein
MKQLLFLTTAAITLVVSIAIALLYFRLAMELVPPSEMSRMNRSAGQIAFVFWGLGIGLALVALEALLFWLLPNMLRGRPAPPRSTPSTPTP